MDIGRPRPLVRCVLAALLVVVAPVSLFAESASSQSDAGKAFKKLTRGCVNVVTGWVELPKRILETSDTSGPVAGWTWGLLRGIGYGFTRTAAGFYELFTFPFPAPPGYEPVIEPEYVFTDAGSQGSRNNTMSHLEARI